MLIKAQYPTEFIPNWQKTDLPEPVELLDLRFDEEEVSDIDYIEEIANEQYWEEIDR